MGEDERAGDDHLLAELRGLFARAEEPPAWAVEAAKASFDLRSIDAELALLIWDSATDPAAITVRGAQALTEEAARSLSFEAADLALEVEVGPPGPDRRLIGQLVPAQPARIEVVMVGGGVSTAEVDELGRFSALGVRSGLLRIVVHRPGLRPTATDWVRVE
jgi:hypothetical protein